MKRKYIVWIGLAALAVILVATVVIAQEPDCERPRRPTPTPTATCPALKPVVYVHYFPVISTEYICVGHPCTILLPWKAGE